MSEKGISSRSRVLPSLMIVALFVLSGFAVVGNGAGKPVAQTSPAAVISHPVPHIKATVPSAEATSISGSSGPFNYVVPSVTCPTSGVASSDPSYTGGYDLKANTLFLNESCSFTGALAFQYNVSVGQGTTVAFNGGSVMFIQRSFNSQTVFATGYKSSLVRGITVDPTGSLMIYNETSFQTENHTGITNTLPIVLDPYLPTLPPTGGAICPAAGIQPTLEIYNSHIGSVNVPNEAYNNATINWGGAQIADVSDPSGLLTGHSTSIPYVCNANGIVYIVHSDIFGSVAYGTSTAYLGFDNITYAGAPHPSYNFAPHQSLGVAFFPVGNSGSVDDRVSDYGAIVQSLATIADGNYPGYAPLGKVCPRDNVSAKRDTANEAGGTWNYFICANGPLPAGIPGAVENGTIFNHVSVSTTGYLTSAVAAITYAICLNQCQSSYYDIDGVDYQAMPIASNLTFSATNLSIDTVSGGSSSSLAVSTGGSIAPPTLSSVDPAFSGPCQGYICVSSINLGENINLNGVTITTGGGWNATWMPGLAETNGVQSGTPLVNYAASNATAYIVLDGSGNVTANELSIDAPLNYSMGMWIGNVTNSASITNSVFTDTAGGGQHYLPQFIFGLQGLNDTVPNLVNNTNLYGQFSIPLAFDEIAGMTNFTLASNTFISSGFNGSLEANAVAGITAFTTSMNENWQYYDAQSKGSQPVLPYARAAGIDSYFFDNTFDLTGMGSLAGRPAYPVLSLSNSFGEASLVGNHFTTNFNGSITAIYEAGGNAYQFVFPYLDLVGNTFTSTFVVNNYNWLVKNNGLALTGGAFFTEGTFGLVSTLLTSTSIDMSGNTFSLSQVGYPVTAGAAYFGGPGCPSAKGGVITCDGIAGFLTYASTTLWNAQHNTMTLTGAAVGFGGLFGGVALYYGYDFYGTGASALSSTLGAWGNPRTAWNNPPLGWAIPLPKDLQHYLDLPLSFTHSPLHPNIINNTFTANGGADLFNGYGTQVCNFALCNGASGQPGSNTYFPYWAEDGTDDNLYIGANIWKFDAQSIFSYDESNLEVVGTITPTVLLASYQVASAQSVLGAPEWNLYINASASQILQQPGVADYEGLAYGSDISWDTSTVFTDCPSVKQNPSGVGWGTWELVSASFASVYSSSPCDRAWLFSISYSYSFPTGEVAPAFNWTILYNGTAVVNVNNKMGAYMSIQHTTGNNYINGVQTTEQLEFQTYNAPPEILTAGPGAIGINPLGLKGGPVISPPKLADPDVVATYSAQLAPSYEYDQRNFATTGSLLPDPLLQKAPGENGMIGQFLQPLSYAAQLPAIHTMVYFPSTSQTANVSWIGGSGVIMFGQPIVPTHVDEPNYADNGKLIGGDNITTYPAAITSGIPSGWSHIIHLEPAIVPGYLVANTTLYNASGGYVIYGSVYPTSYTPSGQNTATYLFQVGENGLPYTVQTGGLSVVGLKAIAVRPEVSTHFYLEPVSIQFAGLQATANGATTYPYEILMGNASATNWIAQAAPGYYNRSGQPIDYWFAGGDGTLNFTISGTVIDNQTLAVDPAFTASGLGPIGNNLDNTWFWVEVGIGVILSASVVFTLYWMNKHGKIRSSGSKRR